MEGQPLLQTLKHNDFVNGIVEKLTELNSILEKVEKKGKSFADLRKITSLVIELQDSEVEEYIYMNSDLDELWRYLDEKMIKLKLTR